MRNLFLILFASLMMSCTSKESGVITGPSIYSDTGHAAYIVESELGGQYQTQVLVKYSSGDCGSGVVSALGKDVDLELKWIDSNTLVILNPSNIKLVRNASGEYLKCGKEQIKVIIETPNKAVNNRQQAGWTLNLPQ